MSGDALYTITFIAAASYGSGVLLFFAARQIIGERSSMIAFINTFAEWLLLPSLPLMALVLLLGYWTAALWCVPPTLMFLSFYARQYIPRKKPMPADKPLLRVLTYNLLADTRPLDQAIAMLCDSSADLIALQEVSQHNAPLLHSALSQRYPYSASHPQPLRFDGQALYSRYPLSGESYWQYDWIPTPLGHQRAIVQADAGWFVVYNVHPTHPGMNGKYFDPTFRAREVADILVRIDHETLPIILLGDFNMPDHSDDYKAILTRLSDSYRQVGWGMGWTFRAWLPLAFLRLDYIFHSQDWEALTCEIMADHGGSDHFAVMATLAFSASE